MEKQLQEEIQLPDPHMSQTVARLLCAGGKRLRPSFCLLTARFHPCDPDGLIPLAVALELIHLASLVHDDVVDSALTRRGQPTVKSRWGNRISTHVGDYLFARSLVLISTYRDQPLIQSILAETSVKMCEGEIKQIASSFDLDQNLKDYLDRIKRKTALLIAASCQLGSMASSAPPQMYIPLGHYGYCLGMAFQITDDILDMTADQKELGKPIGSDLRQGVITLPVIRALSCSPHRQRLRELVAMREKSDAEVEEIVQVVKECRALEYSSGIAKRYIEKAKKNLDKLPDNGVKPLFYLIADYIAQRRF